MKTQSASTLVLCLVPSVIAFFPYTPSWKCSGENCISIKRSDAVESIPVSQLNPEIPTLKLRRMKSSQNTESQKSRLGQSSRRVLKKSILETQEQLEKRQEIVTSSEPTQANSAAIDEDPLDYSYFASIDFGSKKTPLWMLLDTGSFLSWVPSTSCTSLSCLNPTHSVYGPENSTTYNASSTTFGLAYGTGSVKGVIATDSLTLAGLTVDLSFGSASTTSDDFNNFPFDGILGLGNLYNYLGYLTFMGVVAQNKLLKSNVFGIDLSRAEDGSNDGEISFGAPDTSKYSGSLSYTPVVEGSSSWTIALDDAGYNGKSAGLTGRSALIDTGTSYVIIPKADAAQLFALVDNATLDADNSTYMVPCDTTTPIQFTFSGVSFDLSSKDWVGPVTDSSKNLCASNIYPLDGATNIAGEWLVGDTFLKNVYSVFDCDQNRVGFGAKTGSSGTAVSSTVSSSATGSATPSSAGSPLLPAGASATISTGSTSASPSASGSSSSSSSSSHSTSAAASIPRLDLAAAVGLALVLGSSMLLF